MIFYPDDLFSPVIWVMESALDIRIYLLFDVQAKPRGGKFIRLSVMPSRGSEGQNLKLSTLDIFQNLKLIIKNVKYSRFIILL